MNLLCVVPSYWPAFQYGGPVFSNHSFNKALVKKNINVSVYTTNVGLDRKVPVNKEVNIDCVKITYFAYTRFFEVLGATGWQFSLSMTKALRENIKKFDIIYILSVWNYPVSIAAHYCCKYEKPYILTPRGMLYSYTLNKKILKKMSYYYLIAKRDLENASAIHYTTEDEAKQCHSALGLKNKALVIPNGVDLTEFNDLSSRKSLCKHLPYLKGKKLILFMGRIHPIKGLDILIKTYARIVKERDDVHLLIVGNYESGYFKKVKSWLKEYGLTYIDLTDQTNVTNKTSETIPNPESCVLHPDAKITFTGMLTGKEKLTVFAGSDIFVLPSYSENFGMAAVEAMACGIPVVISNKVGIYREVAKNKAGIIVETNPENLYKGIKTILDNETLRKEIAVHGKRLVKEYYDVDTLADRMIEVYDKILQNYE